MAVGAHADDVELRVGGTLAKYHAAGYEIIYVMSTNNFSGNWKVLTGDRQFKRTDPSHTKLMPQRKLEAANGARHFGTTPIHLDHPQQLDHQMEAMVLRQWPGASLPCLAVESSP